jgi:hypothetical protein
MFSFQLSAKGGRGERVRKRMTEQKERNIKRDRKKEKRRGKHLKR